MARQYSFCLREMILLARTPAPKARMTFSHSIADSGEEIANRSERSKTIMRELRPFFDMRLHSDDMPSHRPDNDPCRVSHTRPHTIHIFQRKVDIVPRQTASRDSSTQPQSSRFANSRDQCECTQPSWSHPTHLGSCQRNVRML